MNLSVMLTYATILAGCGSAPVSQPPSSSARPAAADERVVTITDLASAPERFVDSAVRVTGRLENLSVNYFSRNRRIVITNDKSSVDVKPWLPLSAPPSSASDEQRPTLAAYLDQDVELLATVRKAEGRQGAPAFFLEVKEAKIVKRR